MSNLMYKNIDKRDGYNFKKICTFLAKLNNYYNLKAKFLSNDLKKL